MSFCFELVEGCGVRRIFIHVDHSWFARLRGSERFEKEVLGRVRISCRTQEEIKSVALRINGSIQVHPLLFHLDGRFVNPPGIGGGIEVGSAALLQVGRVTLNSTRDRGSGDEDRRAGPVRASSLRDRGS